MSVDSRPAKVHDLINDEFMDSLDEELELEIDDERLAALLVETAEHRQQDAMDRGVYFKELLNLQRP